MYRCPSCRARKEFYVRRLGYRYIVKADSKAFTSKDYTVVLKKDLITRLLDLIRKPLLGELTEDEMIEHAKHTGHEMTCSCCKHKDSVQNFMDAYNDPMKYFDTANLCDCGGEVWQDIEVLKPTNKIEIEGEEDFNGYQRKVTSQVRTVVRCERCLKQIN